MDRSKVAFLLITAVGVAQPNTPIISDKQARQLVRAALASSALRVPAHIALGSGGDQPGLYFFSVYGPANPNGSSTIGHFLVDSKTGDVWGGVVCEEYRTPALIKLQASIRKRFGLTDALYQRMKRQPGPFCEDSK